MKKNESKTALNNSNFTMMMAVVMLSVLFLLIGIVMLVFPHLELKNFAYVTGGFFLAGGAWEITRYFLKEEYRNIANYDFSIGISLLIAGVIIVLRVESVVVFMYLLLGALVLLEAITLLQYTVDLKALGSGGWWATLIGSAALVVMSVGILLDYNGWFSGNGLVLYPTLIASGAIGLIALFCVGLRVKHFEEGIHRQTLRELEEDIDFPVAPVAGTYIKETPKKAIETEKKDEDPFVDEGITAEEEPKTDTKRLRSKILSLKERKKKKEDRMNEDIFEDEDEDVV